MCHGFAAFHKETHDTQACFMGFHSEPMTHKCVSWVYDETVRLSSDCLSVMFVHPTWLVEIFGNFFTQFVPWSSVDICGVFYDDRPRDPLR